MKDFLRFGLIGLALLCVSAHAEITEIFNVTPGGRLKVAITDANGGMGEAVYTDGARSDSDRKTNGIVTFTLTQAVRTKQVTILDPIAPNSPLIYEKIYDENGLRSQHVITPVLNPPEMSKKVILEIDFSQVLGEYPLTIGSKVSFVNGLSSRLIGVTVYDATALIGDLAPELWPVLTGSTVAAQPLFSGSLSITSYFETVRAVPEPSSLWMALAGLAVVSTCVRRRNRN